MTQQINLLFSIPQKEKVRFPAALCFNIIGILLIVLLLISSFSGYRYLKVKRKEEALITKISGLQQSLMQLQGKYPKQEKEIATVQDKIDYQKQLLLILQSRLKIYAVGFSQYFAGFATAIVPGVWLNAIHISSAGRLIVLNGFTTNYTKVGIFVNRLSQVPAFHDRAFHLSKVEQNKKSIVGSSAALAFSLTIRSGGNL